jgi:hypothetical protein
MAMVAAGFSPTEADQLRHSMATFKFTGGVHKFRAMREVLAKRIIEVAQRGEKDKRKLAADAVKFLATNYMDNNVGRRTAAKRGGSEVPERRRSPNRWLYK